VAVDESTDAQARRKKAAKTWEKCRPLRQGEQSPGAAYLIKRKIAVDKASSLRWSPRLATPNDDGELVKMPALVARIETWDGRFRGVQRVFLDRSGEKAALTGGAKKHQGDLGEGGVWSGNRQARRVLLTEGVEDALAAITALPSDTLETHAVVASAGAPRMVLDCENLTCINSTGRRANLIGARACRQADGKLTGYFGDIRQQCRPVMEMNGFLSVIDCQGTCEAALDALA
ncbi:MAG: hypothetical protein OXU19_17805, partial [bacterium]|nr:hypothetical protein [bacterium]